MTLLENHKDPEYYTTTGCQFSSSCFDGNKEPICPFPQCIEDKGGVRAAKKALVLNLHSQGIPVDDIVVRLNSLDSQVSKTQIYQLLNDKGRYFI